MAFLIEDSDGAPGEGGWAKNVPIEGWIFTILRDSASRFETFKDAQRIADRHYNPGRKVRVRIVEDFPGPQPPDPH